jgi:hypothetical protein
MEHNMPVLMGKAKPLTISGTVTIQNNNWSHTGRAERNPIDVGSFKIALHNQYPGRFHKADKIRNRCVT